LNCECEICKNHKMFKMPNEILNASKIGKLVLFCGAGISTENKTVLPYSFYMSIQKELNINDNSLFFSELMQKYCDLPNGRRKLLRKIKKRFEYIHSFPELERRATAFHSELAELYFVKTIITTNWDTYFEEYCAATPITIPEDYVFWDENERCVLKIHGSISNLSTIIATTNDYIKCKKNLEKGIIGATLKTILANQTIVFIGFSFGDDDFAQILNYLRTEMKEIIPHIFIITLDEYLEDKLNYSYSTNIITDGTYFLHQLKLILKESKLIENCGAISRMDTAYELIQNLHKKIAEIDMHKYPSVIYCLSYQEGIIHAFERYMQLYRNGNYNMPGQISISVSAYEKIVQNCSESENYWDEAYYEGYSNGLIFIALCTEVPDIINVFPFTYLPNTQCLLDSYDVFFKELQRASQEKDKYHTYAVKITKKSKEDNMAFHHSPY